MTPRPAPWPAASPDAPSGDAAAGHCASADPTPWLDAEQLVAWKRVVAIVELLPSVLDAQLRRDSGLTHFEYFVLAMLSEAPDRTLRMTGLAQHTNASLTRLSHVVRRLEERRLVERSPSVSDGRATDARLTDDGWEAVVAAAPGHVAAVREHVIDPLTPDQVKELSAIAAAILRRLDPDARLAVLSEAD